MKILHLIYTTGIAGAEKHLKHLLPGLNSYNINCDLIIVCPPKSEASIIEYCNELNLLGVNTSIIISKKRNFIQTSNKIAKYLKEKNIKILHSHLFKSDIIAALVKTLFFPKLVVLSTKHGYQEKVLENYEPEKPIEIKNLYFYITRWFLSKIDENVAVSKGISEFYYKLKISNKIYPVVHHGITVNSFNAEKFTQECRKSHPQLIIVGRLELFKGHRYLLAALPEVIKHFPSLKLLVLGDGSQKENLVKQAENLGIINNVEFLGFKTHPYSYLAHSEIIILPSLFEPFGLVYIEAFALKVPVIAFNVPAANEIIENGKTGLLVEKGNSEAITQKILYLLNNDTERKNIAENAFLKYKQNFTTEKMVERMAVWYKNLNISKY